MDLDALSALVSSGFEPKIEVHAIDPSIYLIYCRIGEQLKPLLKADGNFLKYPSRSKAIQQLRKTGLRRVDFVHRSAYEEMIGFEHSTQPTEHRETLNLTPHSHGL
jgi:hypothetical protein